MDCLDDRCCTKSSKSNHILLKSALKLVQVRRNTNRKETGTVQDTGIASQDQEEKRTLNHLPGQVTGLTKGNANRHEKRTLPLNQQERQG